MKIFYTKEDIEELDVIVDLVKDFTKQEKREFITFLQGAKFAKKEEKREHPKEQFRGA